MHADGKSPGRRRLPDRLAGLGSLSLGGSALALMPWLGLGKGAELGPAGWDTGATRVYARFVWVPDPADRWSGRVSFFHGC
jgi:hypothetical protein